MRKVQKSINKKSEHVESRTFAALGKIYLDSIRGEGVRVGLDAMEEEKEDEYELDEEEEE